MGWSKRSNANIERPSDVLSSGAVRGRRWCDVAYDGQANDEEATICRSMITREGTGFPMCRCNCHSNLESDAKDEDDEASLEEGHDIVVASKREESDELVKVAVAMVRGYKMILSPVMPKSCRFVPTCSSYSIGKRCFSLSFTAIRQSQH